MKNYIKELLFLVFQLLSFYVFPLFAGPTDAIGMVLLILLTTFSLSFFLGAISINKIKFIFPIITSVVFVPSVFIYYNESALIHSVWHLAVSGLGLISGSVINFLIRKIK